MVVGRLWLETVGPRFCGTELGELNLEGAFEKTDRERQARAWDTTEAQKRALLCETAPIPFFVFFLARENFLSFTSHALSITSIRTHRRDTTKANFYFDHAKISRIRTLLSSFNLKSAF